jgi:O-antigen/teichoic acid export membrane protein
MKYSDKSLALFSRDIITFSLKLITGAIIARRLGPSAMGVWILLMMLPQYAEAFGRLKFDVAAVYFLGKKRFSIEKVMFHLDLIALTSSAILISLYLIAVAFWGFSLDENADINPLTIWLMLLYIPLHFITINYQYLLLHLEDVRSYNILVVIRGTASSILAITLLFVTELDILALPIAWNIAAILGVVYGHIVIRKEVEFKFSIDFDMIKEMSKYSYKLYLFGLLSHLNSFLSSAVVAVTLSPNQLAFFRMGQNRTQLLERIPVAIGTFIYPTVSKSDKSRNNPHHLTNIAFRISLLLMILMGVIASLLIYPFTIIIYGKAFIQTTLSFWIIIPSVVFKGSSSILLQYFLGIGRPDLQIKIFILPLLLQISLLYILIPLYGFIGAAVSVSITFTFLAISIVYTYLFVSKQDMSVLIPERSDFTLVYSFIARKISSIGIKMK